MLIEQAKNLYERAEYRAALHNFESVARQPVPMGRDVWFDAMFGIAECRRLSNDFRGAVDGYRAVLGSGLRALSRSGPYAFILRMYVIQSFLMLARIGRLSLRVPSPLLLDFLEFGHRWASEHIEPRAANMLFRFEYALLRRNTHGPAAAARDLDALAEEFMESPVPGGIDHHVIRTWAAESWLDAGVRTTLPALPPPDHFAYHWATYRRKLQRARWHLLANNRRRARWTLRGESIEAELESRHPGLVLELFRLRSALSAGVHDAGYRERIIRNRPRSSVHNLAAYIWHLVQLVRLQGKRSGGGFAWDQIVPATEQLHHDMRRLHDAISAPLVAATLKSRGLGGDEYDAVVAWTRSPRRADSWNDGTRLLTTLEPLVRP